MQNLGYTPGDLFKPQTEAGPSPAGKFPPVHLKVRGVENVASFKNSKEIIQLPIKGTPKCGQCGKRPGRPMLITKPERKKQMAAITESFVSQLQCELATRGIATLTGRSLLCSIASWVPLDDSRKWIVEINVSSLPVAKGDEGADIVIDRIK